MIDLQKRRLKDTIPNNLLIDEKVMDLSEVFTDESNIISVYAYKLNYTMDVRELPEEVIDHLLWENHINRPEEGLLLAKTFDEKVNLLEASIDLHRTKGTPYAIERALQAVSIKGDVVEWFETNSAPYHFLVEIQPTPEINRIDDVRKLVLHYKNKRSWFDGFVILLEGGEILIYDDSYHYPVYYKTTCEFSGEKDFNQSTVGTIQVVNDSYDYLVGYPVAERFFRQVELDSVAVVDETYDYIKCFPVTGEMETLSKQVTILSESLVVRDNSYDFQALYPTCGEFYAEGDG